jgi:chromosome segregation ATPase
VLLPGTPKPAEVAAGVQRFRLTVEPKKTATLTVEEALPRDDRVTISSMTDEQLEVLLRGATATAQLQAALKPIIEKKRELAAIARDLAVRRAEVDRIATDQQRVRENMKALKGSAEEKALVQRYARQLNDQEDRLEVLRKETSELERRLNEAQAELDRLIEALALDVTI